MFRIIRLERSSKAPSPYTTKPYREVLQFEICKRQGSASP